MLNKIFSILEKGLILLYKKRIIHEKVNKITARFTKLFPNIKKTGNVSNIKKFNFVNKPAFDIVIL